MTDETMATAGAGSPASAEARAYHTPAHRLDRVREALDVLHRATGVVLTTHVNADGDGIGCQAALARYLEDRGIRAWIVNPTPFPDLYRFLLPRPSLVVHAASQDAPRIVEKADLAVVVDTSESSRLGRVKPLLDSLPKVVVDHHPSADKPIEGLTLVDSSACAAGELVYDLVLEGGGPLDQAMAEALYVAILTDTGSFRFSNSTAACHRMASDMVALGVQPDELYRHVYGSPPLRHYRLLRAALDHLEVHDEGGVAWMTVPLDAFRDLGAEPSDLEGFVDYPRSIQGVDVGILFRALDEGWVKISFRSNRDVNVNALARRFGGGGHARAAGARVAGALEEVRARVLAEAVRALREAQEEAPQGAGEGAAGSTGSGGEEGEREGT